MRDLTVAAVNFRAEFGRIEANLDRMEAWAGRLAGQGVELICLPELSVCGYDHTEKIRPVAQPIPGPATGRLVKIAAECGLALVTSLVERPPGPGERLFISQVIATPAGLAGVYRKTHLGPAEGEIFQPGGEIGVFKQPGYTLGLQLCYDAHYPEVSTLQALAGAEVLCIGFASPRDDPAGKRERMLRYLPARAYDNSCYVLACNLVGSGQSGQSFAGVALVLNPKGELLAEAVGWEEGAAVARLSGAEVDRIRRTRMGYFLAHRRPWLYGGLTDNSSREE